MSPSRDILIVDDHAVNLSVLSSLLTAHGYEVRAALSGPMALMSAEHAPPDLILLDMNMPEMSGLEVCRRLKAGERTRDVPVIFISALDAAADKVAAFDVGGVDYITKPFQFGEVLARVAMQLTLQRQRKELEAQRKELESQRKELEVRYQRIEELKQLAERYLGRLGRGVGDPAGAAGGARAPVREVRTVLVSGIAGAAGLGALLDPGPLVADLGHYLDLLAESVHRAPGEIHDVRGGCVLASFADAAGAFQAALRIQRRVAAFNERQALIARPILDTRLALATGSVVVAELCVGGQQRLALLGEAVALAGRLEPEAPVGGALLDEASWSRAGCPEGAVLRGGAARGQADPPLYEIADARSVQL
jgi:adenylate cyclase